MVLAAGLAVQSLIHAALAEAAQTSEVSDQALQSLNALDGWSFYPVAIGLSTFVLASGVALVRGHALFVPFFVWAALVLGVLGLVPIVGFFAAVLSAIWVVTISHLGVDRGRERPRPAGRGSNMRRLALGLVAGQRLGDPPLGTW